jgi:heme-degrading monooxygenase HmoA
MICRMWHGRTLRAKADAYAIFLAQRAIPDYRSVPGNLSVAVMRRDEKDVTHFLTVTHWESEDSIRAFAGASRLKPSTTRKTRAIFWSSSRRCSTTR